MRYYICFVFLFYIFPQQKGFEYISAARHGAAAASGGKDASAIACIL